MKRGRGLYDKAALDDRRGALFDRIETWRSLQPLFQPGVTQLRQTHATRTDGLPVADDAKKPESIALFLPSSMPIYLWETGCVSGLLEKERRLREAEATDALNGLRRQLRIMMGVFQYKKTHVSGAGQRANTRARTMMTKISEKTQLFVERYRAARLALSRIDPDGSWSVTFLPLRTKDVRGPQRNDDDESEGRRELSWIWLSPNANHRVDADDAEVAEGLFIYLLSTSMLINIHSCQVCVLNGPNRTREASGGLRRWFCSGRRCAALLHSWTSRRTDGVKKVHGVRMWRGQTFTMGSVLMVPGNRTYAENWHDHLHHAGTLFFTITIYPRAGF